MDVPYAVFPITVNLVLSMIFWYFGQRFVAGVNIGIACLAVAMLIFGAPPEFIRNSCLIESIPPLYE